MSDEAWGFAPPPLEPASARQQLLRALRDLKLVERGSVFTLRGRPVFEIVATPASADASTPPLTVRLARRPAQTPDWETRSLRSSGELRSCVDEMRRRVERWNDDD